MKWTPNSWEGFPIKQQPNYSADDLAKIKLIKEKIRSYPGIVSEKTITDLRKSLAKVESREAFILQGGDCAETFSGFNTQNLTSLFRLFLQMNVVLLESLNVPIVKIGRVAGQYAKPRSADLEEVNGIVLPSYRGDIVNDIEFTIEGRRANPERVMQTYFHAVATYNFIQELAHDGYASLINIQKFSNDFVAKFGAFEKYNGIIDKVNKHLKFLSNCGYPIQEDSSINKADFFVSHEALLLHYEEGFVREIDGKNYCLSADMLWIGDRTRDVGGAHVEFLRGIENPVGIKVGPSTETKELQEIIKKLNPKNEHGKIVLIVRMGVEKIAEKFPPILKEISKSNLNVVWQIDPMHGNIIKLENGYKTRKVEDIVREIKSFFEIHKKFGTYAGGVHLEMTGGNVTECIGGMQNILGENLPEKYETYCDPRLNASQALQVMLDIMNN